MDFLTVSFAYLCLFGLCFFIYMMWDRPWMYNSVLGHGVRLLGQTVSGFLPNTLKGIVWQLLDFLFNRKNHFFQLAYVLLVGGGHLILVVDILPTLYHYSWHENHVFWPIILAFLNGMLYVSTCLTDPGVVSERNILKFSSMYDHDGVFYKKAMCPTCSQSKPARSKHCRTCDHCVFRFDHHCVWTNCCIGGLNYRYFLAFCLSLALMCADGAWMAVRALRDHTDQHGLWRARYVDDDGTEQDMTTRVLIQHLFMTFPRVVFLATALSLISLMMIGYMGYHAYLLKTNQTTNERIKLGRILLRQGFNGPARSRDCRPYDRGAARNLKEALQPYKFLGRDRMYRTKWK